MKLDSQSLYQATVKDSFLNSSGLDSVRKMGRNDDPKAMREMARQFESLFVQQMFKSMRAASEVFSEDSFMNSSETTFYQQMLDQQLSLEMTQGRGIGLADALYRQMMNQYGEHFEEPEEAGLKPDSLPNRRDDFQINQSSSAPENSSQSDSVQSFVDAITPYARWAANALGVQPQALVAQAALETGWGEHVIRDDQGQSSFNLFNIKADERWEGDSVRVTTQEFNGGDAYKTEAAFRRYQSIFESFSDYVEFLRQPRYQQALASGNDAEQFVEQLQAAGYATDPQYAEKLKSIMQREEVSSSQNRTPLAPQGWRDS